MAAFKIELEIDSAAHPELYAILADIGNDGYRAERFRQLASTGLIWEQMRATKPSKPPKKDALTLPVLRDEVLPDQYPPQPPLPEVTHDVAPDTAPIVHMSGKRSRLMRMKSRGLFTNE
jgi:hypothetical protein